MGGCVLRSEITPLKAPGVVEKRSAELSDSLTVKSDPPYLGTSDRRRSGQRDPSGAVNEAGDRRRLYGTGRAILARALQMETTAPATLSSKHSEKHLQGPNDHSTQTEKTHTPKPPERPSVCIQRQQSGPHDIARHKSAATGPPARMLLYYKQQ